MRLISHSLTAMKRFSGIQSLIGFSNLAAPSPFSALPPIIIHNASPKAISVRTSYLRVRLEFLRYPQIIPAFFNIRVVRTSTASYRRFILPMDRSPGFGSTICNSFALFRLGFPAASNLRFLTSLQTYTRRTVLQKVPDHSLTSSRCL